MPYQPITFAPGIDVETTPVLTAAGWNAGDNIRFFSGLPQKIGGWTQLNLASSLSALGRGIHGWADNTGVPYIAIGTSNSLELFQGGALYDITPLRATSNNAPNFTTIISTKTVTVIDSGSGTVTNDRINIIVPVSVGGLILQGFYTVTTIDTNTYTIEAATTATSSVSNGGAVPHFASTMGGPNVVTTFANHGYIIGSVFTVQVSTVLSTFTLSGPYTVTAVADAGHFTFQPGGNAGATTTANENGGNVRIEYLIHSGLENATYSSSTGGYGAGDYGSGAYGGGGSSGTILTQFRYWSLSNFGQDLIANYNGSPFYVWEPPNTTGNIAVELNVANFPTAQDPPTTVISSFGSATQQMIIALGCNTPGTSNFDPNLVRWCDAGDFTDWTALSTNQAGSFRIPSGSMLVGGISTSNFNIVWTDVDMWLMSYLGGTLVWGFQKIADAVDNLGPQAAGVFRNTVIWPSSNGFYLYDGAGVRQIPCPVWDKFWYNLNRTQAYKVNAQVNSWFGEISWGYPSADSDEVDSRITYNIRENVWTYDSISRTCWLDDNVYGAPIGTDLDANMQQHETSNDANGTPLTSSISSGWFALSETDYLTFVERFVADFIVTGGDQTIQVTVAVQDWPTGPVTTIGPYNWTAGGTGPEFTISRVRGRLAQISFGSVSLGTFWRLGRVRVLMAQAGRGN